MLQKVFDSQLCIPEYRPQSARRDRPPLMDRHRQSAVVGRTLEVNVTAPLALLDETQSFEGTEQLLTAHLGSLGGIPTTRSSAS